MQNIIKFLGLEFDNKRTDINVSLERNLTYYPSQLSIFVTS